jgi:hypothetical protein
MVLSAALIGLLLAQAAGQPPPPAPPAAPPPETVLTGSRAATSYDSSATFEFHSLPGGATFECKLDDGPFTPCASPRSYSNLLPGAHHFEVRARAAAAPGPTPARHDWTIVLPGTSWTPAPASTFDSAAFVFQSGAAGAAFECKLDDGDFVPCTSPATYTNLRSGDHRFEVRARTAAGADATPESISWSVVPLPRPDTALTGLSGPVVLGSSARFHWAALPDHDVRFECSLDYAPFGDCQGKTRLAGVPPGSHTLQVRAVNDTGPDESPAAYSWTSMVPLADLFAGYAIAERTDTERFPVGWTVSLDLAFADRWQVVSEAGGDYLGPDPARRGRLWRYSFLSGVRFAARSTHVNVFGQGLIGVVRTPDDIAALDRFSYRPSWEPGGGVDFNVNQYVAIRFAGGRRYTRGANDSAWEWRFTNGIVLRFNRLE